MWRVAAVRASGVEVRPLLSRRQKGCDEELGVKQQPHTRYPPSELRTDNKSEGCRSIKRSSLTRQA